mgnify:CR=1 FL=1
MFTCFDFSQIIVEPLLGKQLDWPSSCLMKHGLVYGVECEFYPQIIYTIESSYSVVVTLAMLISPNESFS